MLINVTVIILFGQCNALIKNKSVRSSEAVGSKNIRTEYCYQCLGMLKGLCTEKKKFEF